MLLARADDEAGEEWRKPNASMDWVDRLATGFLNRYGGKDRLKARYRLLARASELISKHVIPRCNMLHLEQSHHGRLLAKCRRLVDSKTKKKPFKEQMDKTYESNKDHRVEIDHPLAASLLDSDDMDHLGEKSMFGQAMRQIDKWSVKDLRVKLDGYDRAFKELHP